jgi:hypothetical protein
MEWEPRGRHHLVRRSSAAIVQGRNRLNAPRLRNQKDEGVSARGGEPPKSDGPVSDDLPTLFGKNLREARIKGNLTQARWLNGPA